MDSLIRLIEAFEFWGWIAVIATVAIIGQTVIVLKKMSIKHNERMAKIANCQDPGCEDQAYKADEL